MVVLAIVLQKSSWPYFFHIFVAAFYAALALYLWSLYKAFFYGVLGWDGRVWYYHRLGEVPHETRQLFVSVDLSWFMLLRAEENTWVFLLQRDYSAHDWLALRRAIHFSSQHPRTQG